MTWASRRAGVQQLLPAVTERRGKRAAKMASKPPAKETATVRGRYKVESQNAIGFSSGAEALSEGSLYVGAEAPTPEEDDTGR